MGCSYYADKDGVFEIVLMEYVHGRELEHIRIVGLEPYGGIDMDIIHGNAR